MGIHTGSLLSGFSGCWACTGLLVLSVVATPRVDAGDQPELPTEELSADDDPLKQDETAAADIRPSDWTQAQALDVTDVDQGIHDRINGQYGLNVRMRIKQP